MTRQDDIKAERRRAAAARRRIVSDPVAGPVCRACGFFYPYVIQLHHIEPLGETGAVNSETAHLCPNCHAMVHEMRRLYYAPNRKRVRFRADRHEQLAYWRDQHDPEYVSKLIDLARRGIE